MSATIIDSLLVTLGIDPRQFVKGADAANKAQRGIGEQSARTTRDTDAHEKKLAAARLARQRTVDAQSKQMAAGIKTVRNELLGLFALFTAGTGIKHFIENTINSAAGLGFLAANLKMSTEEITAWQHASERAGGSKEGIVKQLKESAAAIAALKSGMGPSDSMQWFFRLGGSSKDLQDGNTYLLARAKIVSELFQVDPTRAALMSAQMGVSEEQFDLIKQGPTAILALVAAQRKNSVISAQDAAGALALRNRWLDFKDSLEATTTKILVSMIPAFESLVGWLQKSTAWITDNKDAIGKWVSEFVSKAIPVIESMGRALADVDWPGVARGARTVGAAIVDIAEALRTTIDLWNKWTGRKDVPTAGVTRIPTAESLRFGKREDLAIDDARNGRKSPAAEPKKTGFLANVSDAIEEGLARTLASFGNKSAKEYIRDKTGKDDYLAGPKADPNLTKAAIDRLVKLGWTEAQATGMAANFVHESGLNPAAVGDGGKAYGIGQWHPDRQAEFKAVYGMDMRGSSIRDQLIFADYELRNGGEQKAGRKLAGAKTAAEAATIMSRDFERPKDAAGEAAKRATTATAIDAARRAANPPTGPEKVTQAATMTSDVRIGHITINTKATDAAGIAQDLPRQLEKAGFGFVTQANTGIA